MKKRWIVVIGSIALLVVASIMIFVVPVMGETYYESEPYTTTETYYEREPYTATESYVESQPYTTTVPIDYRVTDTGIYNWFWSIGSDCWVTIKNTDVKSGYFYVVFNLLTEGGATKSTTASQYIAIGEETNIVETT